jgi:methionine-gamma-lyase
VDEDRRPGFATRAIHRAKTPPVDQETPSVPIYQTATFRFEDSEAYAETISFRRPGYTYTRGYGNPTLLAFGRGDADPRASQAAFRSPAGWRRSTPWSPRWPRRAIA